MEEQKLAAAKAAIQYVEDGMRLGLGTGSTAKLFVDLLGEKVKAGLNVLCVPTSEATHAQAKDLDIPLSTLDEVPKLDLTVDGADELDDQLQLIKGGGAALLREKIVAVASERLIIIADTSKHVETLGAFPLPIEVNPFGLKSTHNFVSSICHNHGLKGDVKLRMTDQGEPLKTDGGHWILDAEFGKISDASSLHEKLIKIPGVVETGLFIGIADLAIIASRDDIVTLKSGL